MKQRYWLRLFAIAALGIATLMSAGLQAQQSARDLFERAGIMEAGGQDLRQVIRLYEQAAAQAKSDPALAAESFLRAGYAYEKLSMMKEAEAAFERVNGYKGTSQAAEAVRQLERLRAKTPGPATLTPRLICSVLRGGCGLGFPESASISEDGRSIAISDEGLGSDLAILDLAKGQVVRPLGAAAALDPSTLNSWLNAVGVVSASNPVFSRDGRHVAYTVLGQRVNPVPTGRDPSKGADAYDVLKIIPHQVDGKPRTLVNNPEYQRITAAAWSPDAKSLLVTIAKPDQTWQLAWVSVADGKVTTIKSLGWRFMDGNNGVGRPSLSPDGRRIAYAALPDNPDSPAVWGSGGRMRGYQHIYVLTLAADGSSFDEVAFVKGANINQSPVWTPDGRNILFISNRSGNFGLWSVAATDGNASDPVPVKPDLGRVAVLGMTRSGSYYYAQQVSLDKLLIGPLDGSKSGERNSAPKFLRGTRPSWSPDGTRVAFLRCQNCTDTASLRCVNCDDTLLVYSLDIGEEKRYAAPAGMKLLPAASVWTHDGKVLLLIMRDAGGQQWLYRIELKSGEFKQVLPFPTPISWALSSDDRSVYLWRSENAAGTRADSILAIDLSTGEQRRVWTMPGSALSGGKSIILSPDGKTLYLACEGNQQGPAALRGIATSLSQACSRSLVAVDVKTGEERSILSVEKSEDWTGASGFVLSADGQRFAAVVRKGELQSGVREFDYRVITIGINGNDLRTLYEYTRSGPGGQVFWSPDGRSITLRTDEQLIRIPVDGGRAEVLSRLPVGLPSLLQDSTNTIAIAPDAAHIALSTRKIPLANDREVWAIDNIETFLKTAR